MLDFRYKFPYIKHVVLVWNERIKLLANGLNGVAVAMIALGILAPLANILFRGGLETDVYLLAWWGIGAICMHGTGIWVLEDLV